MCLIVAVIIFNIFCFSVSFFMFCRCVYPAISYMTAVSLWSGAGKSLSGRFPPVPLPLPHLCVYFHHHLTFGAFSNWAWCITKKTEELLQNHKLHISLKTLLNALALQCFRVNTISACFYQSRDARLWRCAECHRRHLYIKHFGMKSGHSNPFWRDETRLRS